MTTWIRGKRRKKAKINEQNKEIAFINTFYKALNDNHSK